MYVTNRRNAVECDTRSCGIDLSNYTKNLWWVRWITLMSPSEHWAVFIANILLHDLTMIYVIMMSLQERKLIFQPCCGKPFCVHIPWNNVSSTTRNNETQLIHKKGNWRANNITFNCTFISRLLYCRSTVIWIGKYHVVSFYTSIKLYMV